ncbi:MAG: hypothetical protein ACTHZ9_04110 [Leucobacter sp.]
MTIEYDDGQQVKASFEDVECSDVKASATSVDPKHASINVHFDADNDNYRSRAWVYADELVLFAAESAEVSRDGDRVTVSGEGSVQIAERAAEDPAPGGGFDAENAVETTGAIEAELTCSS